jgi:thiol-disulfide isomerase/thioredoxin
MKLRIWIVAAKLRIWIVAALLGALGCGASWVALSPPLAGAKRAATARSGGVAPSAERAALPAEGERAAVAGFDGATGWLNVDHPLTLEELRGRVVVVDFWTSCCINCLHTLPTLRQIEARFAGEPVVVIGVHSPKFDEEKGLERLRHVLRDNRVEHPVAVDADMAVWNAWDVRGWPTVAVLDVSGKAVWAGSGEPDAGELERVVESVLGEARARGALASGALAGVRPEPDTATALRYPGKVLALSGGGLAIADTGHDRVVLVDRDGAVEAVVGSGRAGMADGGYADASFRRPQGMAEVGSDLYVADTGNHAVRKIDRRARAVARVAGTGKLGLAPLGADEAPARMVALRSPWDLLRRDRVLYVALAGSHQVGVLDLKLGTVRAFAGNGREARVDGARLEASFAQPSALATDGRELFVLDSETSSVRAVDLASGSVRTVVGLDLFVFGDQDGDRRSARLQHPIGLGFGEGALWVADTYNSKLKRVDPATGATRTVLGGGALAEPAGLSVAGATAWIADTNHHRVVRYVLRAAPSGGAVAPLPLVGLAAPAAEAAHAAQSTAQVDPADPVVSLGTVRIAPGKPSSIEVRWGLPAGTAVNEEAPVKLAWAAMTGLRALPDAVRLPGNQAQHGFLFSVEPAAGATRAELTGVLQLVTCDDVKRRVCLPVRRTVKATFEVAPGASVAAAVLPLPEAR